MSRLNKVFLAIIIALLITAFSEVVFLFVFEEPKKIAQVPIGTSTSTPIPIANLAINPIALKMLESWPSYKNANVYFTQNVNGIVKNIIPSKDNKGVLIVLEGDKADMTNIPITGKNLLTTSVYLQDKNGTTSKVGVSDLKPGDKIMVQFNENLAIDPNEAPLDINIFILQQ